MAETLPRQNSQATKFHVTIFLLVEEFLPMTGSGQGAEEPPRERADDSALAMRISHRTVC
mgnify:CR=1 FL=1